jgi:hypothetical protein
MRCTLMASRGSIWDRTSNSGSWVRERSVHDPEGEGNNIKVWKQSVGDVPDTVTAYSPQAYTIPARSAHDISFMINPLFGHTRK